MHIMYGKVYSLLKLTSKRAPFVVVLDNQNAYDVTSDPIVVAEDSVEGEDWRILIPSLEDPYLCLKCGAI